MNIILITYQSEAVEILDGVFTKGAINFGFRGSAHEAFWIVSGEGWEEISSILERKVRGKGKKTA